MAILDRVHGNETQFLEITPAKKSLTLTHGFRGRDWNEKVNDDNRWKILCNGCHIIGKTGMWVNKYENFLREIKLFILVRDMYVEVIG